MNVKIQHLCGFSRRFGRTSHGGPLPLLGRFSSSSRLLLLLEKFNTKLLFNLVRCTVEDFGNVKKIFTIYTTLEVQLRYKLSLFKSGK